MRPVRAVPALLLGFTLLVGACSGDARDGRASSSATTTTTTEVAPGAATTTAPAGCAPARAAEPGATSGTLAFGGVDRTYTRIVPAGYTGTSAVPVVFDFHGYGSTAGQQVAYSEIAPVADREGFVVVAPDGQGATKHFTLLGATATEADDVDFTMALLDEVERTLCVDASRVYAMGMSNGGALSSVLACRGADRFAAVGAIAAMIYLPACDTASRVVPIVSSQGTADPVVPFAGGRVNCCGNPTIPGAPETMAKFASHAGCQPGAVDSRIGAAVVLHRYAGCKDGAAVDFYEVEGGGHTWPGASADLSGRGLGATTQDIEATEVLWSFFEQHRRTGG